jgi:DNA-binding NarL/FixJ family response regulator
MRPVRIVVADDHKLMLKALRLVLDQEHGFEVVGEADDGAALLPLVARTNPDVVLLDLKMPRMDGITCLERLRAHHPGVRTVVLSAVEDAEVMRAAFARGAAGYVLKRIDPLDLPAAIRQAMDGTVFQAFGGGTAEERPAAKSGVLTARELEILALVADGRSNKQIAAELFLAVQTVKFHLTSLYRKLDAGTRTEAVREAYRQGLLEAPMLQRIS